MQPWIRVHETHAQHGVHDRCRCFGAIDTDVLIADTEVSTLLTVPAPVPMPVFRPHGEVEAESDEDAWRTDTVPLLLAP